MHKIVGGGSQCHVPHSSRRETSHEQITEATCEGPHIFGLQVSQRRSQGWGGKEQEEVEGSGTPGGRLPQAPHPKAGGLDLTRSVSEHHRLGPNPRDPALLRKPMLPPRERVLRNEGAFLRRSS